MFGASWMWQPLWSDRLALFWRVLALQVPLGALVGGALALLHVALAGPLSVRGARRLAGEDTARANLWARRLWPLVFIALAA